MAEHLTKESSLEKIKAHVFFLKSINKGLMDSYWADKLFGSSGPAEVLERCERG
jgi:hypothetical protein